jgi:predicted nucleic acid-binding protein
MTNPNLKRIFPNPITLSKTLKFKKIIISGKRRRLSTAVTIEDLRKIAKRRTPRGPFDYTDGAAESESSLSRARALYSNLEFRPNVLRDVSKLDTSVEILE